MPGKKHRLADLQMAIMHVLWDRGEATVAEVREALAPARPLAHTTVATMLGKMEHNGQVVRRVAGRALHYRPALERGQVGRSMVADLAARLFAGDVSQLVSHLLDGCAVSKQDLARLKKVIRQKEQELPDDRAQS